jgi:hypothetical protein
VDRKSGGKRYRKFDTHQISVTDSTRNKFGYISRKVPLKKIPIIFLRENHYEKGIIKWKWGKFPHKSQKSREFHVIYHGGKFPWGKKIISE